MSTSLQQLQKASAALKAALDAPLDDITRDATIQRFEFCVELAWKAIKKKMGIASVSPKTVIREAAQEKLITDPETWLLYIDARNLSSHTYNEALACQVYETAKNFYPDLVLLLKNLESL